MHYRTSWPRRASPVPTTPYRMPTGTAFMSTLQNGGLSLNMYKLVIFRYISTKVGESVYFIV